MGSYSGGGSKISTLAVDANLDMGTFKLITDEIDGKTDADIIDVCQMGISHGGLQMAAAAVEVLANGMAVAWTDVDCSGTVGSNKCLIFLKVRADAAVQWVDIRGYADQEDMQAPDYYRMNLQVNGIGRCTVFAPDGHIDYMHEDVAGDCHIFVEGFIALT